MSYGEQVSIQHVSLDRYDEDPNTYWAVVFDEEVKTGYADSDFQALVDALKAAGLPFCGNVVEESSA